MADGVNSPAVTLAIQRVIKASGLSRSEIARRLGGNRRSQVQKWYRGSTGITIENARLLEVACGAEPGKLVNVVAAEEAKRAARVAQDRTKQLQDRVTQEVEVRRRLVLGLPPLP